MSRHQRFSGARLFGRLAAALLISTASLVGSLAEAGSYTVIDIATLDEGTTVVVRGPNGADIAVGGGRFAGSIRGLRFARERLQTIMGLPGSDYTTVLGINDVGDMVGSSNTARAVRGFVVTPAGGTRELPPLPGDTASTAFGVNAHRQAAGFSSGSRGEHAVVWSADGSPTALPATSGTGSRAMAINNRGDVVGIADTRDGPRATHWSTGGAAQDLGTLAGHVASAAIGLNARGDVVGYSADASGVRRATLWPSGGTIVDLGTLPGGDFSQALGNNDLGHVVGTSTSGHGSRAVLWTPSAGLRDLNTLVGPSPFVLTQAVGINNIGTIVAIGQEVGHGDGTAEHHHDTHEGPVRVLLLLRTGGQP